jgi:hypothetical protein
MKTNKKSHRGLRMRSLRDWAILISLDELEVCVGLIADVVIEINLFLILNCFFFGLEGSLIVQNPRAFAYCCIGVVLSYVIFWEVQLLQSSGLAYLLA